MWQTLGPGEIRVRAKAEGLFPLMNGNRIDEILDFWLGPLQGPEDIAEEKTKFWFKKDPDFDRRLGEKFEGDLISAREGQFNHWLEFPRGSLAFIILTDQFSRNIYRDSPQAFAQDALARKACLDGLARGFDKELLPLERAFYYMPLEHSEDAQLQETCVCRFELLLEISPDKLKPLIKGFLDYARQHQDIIKRFSRFPHRNKILGRPSSIEEVEFLKSPGSSF